MGQSVVGLGLLSGLDCGDCVARLTQQPLRTRAVASGPPCRFFNSPFNWAAASLSDSVMARRTAWDCSTVKRAGPPMSFSNWATISGFVVDQAYGAPLPSNPAGAPPLRPMTAIPTREPHIALASLSSATDGNSFPTGGAVWLSEPSGLAGTMSLELPAPACAEAAATASADCAASPKLHVRRSNRRYLPRPPMR